MMPEKKRNIAKGLSLLVIIAGIAVILGWIFDIAVLKSISPAWTSMKFVTAFTFILSGITLYFIVRALEGRVRYGPGRSFHYLFYNHPDYGNTIFLRCFENTYRN